MAYTFLALQLAVVAAPHGVLPGWVPRPLSATVLAGLVGAALAGWMWMRAAAGKSFLPANARDRAHFALLALAPLVALGFCL